MYTMTKTTLAEIMPYLVEYSDYADSIDYEVANDYQIYVKDGGEVVEVSLVEVAGDTVLFMFKCTDGECGEEISVDEIECAVMKQTRIL
jgi:hypothetical protein